MELLGPYEFEEGGILRVAGGFLGYYPSFWNTLTQLNEPAPAGQKMFYGTLFRHIKSMATKAKAGRRSYWVGPVAAAAMLMATAFSCRDLDPNYANVSLPGASFKLVADSPAVRRLLSEAAKQEEDVARARR